MITKKKKLSNHPYPYLDHNKTSDFFFGSFLLQISGRRKDEK